MRILDRRVSTNRTTITRNRSSSTVSMSRGKTSSSTVGHRPACHNPARSVGESYTRAAGMHTLSAAVASRCRARHATRFADVGTGDAIMYGCGDHATYRFERGYLEENSELKCYG
jgi:hypothetical protein